MHHACPLFRRCSSSSTGQRGVSVTSFFILEGLTRLQPLYLLRSFAEVHCLGVIQSAFSWCLPAGVGLDTMLRGVFTASRVAGGAAAAAAAAPEVAHARAMHQRPALAEKSVERKVSS